MTAARRNLGACEAKWRRRLQNLQHAYPARWRVPGLSEEEVRDILTLRLIEVVRTEASDFSKYERAGREWGMQCLQEHLRARVRALAQQRAELGLSRPQRQWLAALKRSVNAGAFFDSSERPNLSAASRVLGKDRSSAQRAYRELQSRFIEELRREE